MWWCFEGMWYRSGDRLTHYYSHEWVYGKGGACVWLDKERVVSVVCDGFWNIWGLDWMGKGFGELGIGMMDERVRHWRWLRKPPMCECVRWIWCRIWSMMSQPPFQRLHKSKGLPLFSWCVGREEEKLGGIDCLTVSLEGWDLWNTKDELCILCAAESSSCTW